MMQQKEKKKRPSAAQICQPLIFYLNKLAIWEWLRAAHLKLGRDRKPQLR